MQPTSGEETLSSAAPHFAQVLVVAVATSPMRLSRGQRLAKVAQFLIHFGRIGHRPADFLAQDLAVADAQSLRVFAQRRCRRTRADNSS